MSVILRILLIIASICLMCWILHKIKIIIFALLIKVFTLSTAVSQLEEKIVVLAAEVAVRSQAQQKQIDTLKCNEEQRKTNK